MDIKLTCGYCHIFIIQNGFPSNFDIYKIITDSGPQVMETRLSIELLSRSLEKNSTLQ